VEEAQSWNMRSSQPSVGGHRRWLLGGEVSDNSRIHQPPRESVAFPIHCGAGRSRTFSVNLGENVFPCFNNGPRPTLVSSLRTRNPHWRSPAATRSSPSWPSSRPLARQEGTSTYSRASQLAWRASPWWRRSRLVLGKTIAAMARAPAAGVLSRSSYAAPATVSLDLAGLQAQPPCRASPATSGLPLLSSTGETSR